jgi:cell division protein FtsZ
VITLPGIINLDFADVRRIMSEAGPALLAIGRGRGENRAADAARAAITSPLLETSIAGATGVLFNVVGGGNLGLQEVNAAARVIYEVVNSDAEIVFGAATDPDLGDEVKVTVIATGFLPQADHEPEPEQIAEPEPEEASLEEPEAQEETLQQQPAFQASDYPQVDTELPAFLRRTVTAR